MVGALEVNVNYCLTSRQRQVNRNPATVFIRHVVHARPSKHGGKRQSAPLRKTKSST